MSDVTADGYADVVAVVPPCPDLYFEVIGPHVTVYSNGTVKVETQRGQFTTSINNVVIFWTYNDPDQPQRVVKLTPKGVA